MTTPETTETHSAAIAAGGCRGSFATGQDPDHAGHCNVCVFRGEPTADGYVTPHAPVPEFRSPIEFEPLPTPSWIAYGMANR